MPWNPDIYNQFKSIRYQPFFDLIELIDGERLHTAIDIGCGTGEQTHILSQTFENCSFVGIDSSQQMLQESEAFVHSRLRFEKSSIEDFAESDSKWDLIFSNAALQWANDHKVLFPKLISKLNQGGQFAVQMPFQTENILNVILLEMIKEYPFSDYLENYTRESPVLSIDEYATIMFENGLDPLNISLKVYPIIANNEMELYNFISGSALIPYMERLHGNQQEEFKKEFIHRIVNVFKKYPAIYSFKRLLLYGGKR